MPSQRIVPSDEVIVSSNEGILRVTISRPERRNALSLGVLARLQSIFTEFAADSSIRVAVIRGAGEKAFASGGDVVELSAVRSADEARAMSEHGKSSLASIRSFPVPVVAALNGVALGGGAELALACDQRFAAPTARIGFIHGQLNIAPSWGGGVDLMHLVGPAKGLKLLTSCRQLGGEEALAEGLVDDVAPAGADFGEALDAFLDANFSFPAQVMRAMKSLALGERQSCRSGLDEAETRHFAEAWVHADHWAAVAERTGRKAG